VQEHFRGSLLPRRESRQLVVPQSKRWWTTNPTSILSRTWCMTTGVSTLICASTTSESVWRTSRSSSSLPSQTRNLLASLLSHLVESNFRKCGARSVLPYSLACTPWWSNKLGPSLLAARSSRGRARDEQIMK
jgi:hypothetical protein